MNGRTWVVQRKQKQGKYLKSVRGEQEYGMQRMGGR